MIDNTSSVDGQSTSYPPQTGGQAQSYPVANEDIWRAASQTWTTASDMYTPIQPISPTSAFIRESLPVGTPVMLVEGSSYTGQSQHYPGIITEVSNDGSGRYYTIRWENNIKNHYREGDIIVIPMERFEYYKALALEKIKEQVEKEKQLKEEREKIIKEYTGITKIDVKLYNFFMSELTEFCAVSYDYPFTYLLGQKDNVITTAILLRGRGGCKDMQYITPRELARAYIQLDKKKLLVVGICRVGHFNTNNTYGLNQVKELMGNDAILLSINNDKMWVWKEVTIDDVTVQVIQEYSVVQVKKGKEVKKNGNAKSKEN